MPKGYAIILLDVLDADAYLRYAREATAIEARYGGRPLVADDARHVVEGDWPAGRVVVLEFPTIDAAQAWYHDPDYQTIIPLRQTAATSRIVFVEGFVPADRATP